MTDAKERLKKLYALALRGVGGEKVQAQAILEKMLKKYAMTLDDLDEEVINEYQLEYHGKEQEKLLKQTIYKVTDDSRAFYHLRYIASGRRCKTTLGVKCTAAQKVEIEFLFDFYKNNAKRKCNYSKSKLNGRYRLLVCLEPNNERFYAYLQQ